MLTSKSNWLYLIILSPIVLFWLILWQYAVNVPWFDDIDAFPETVVIWIKHNNWLDRLTLLLRPNNEHRMFLGRLAAVLCYEFTGKLNIRSLILVTNIQLMGIVFLFWKTFTRQKLALIYFLPVLFFLLQPQYHLTSNWAITGWQHISVLFWGFLTVYLLCKNNYTAFGVAIITMFITTFSMSNGLLFWFVGSVLLALQQRFKLLFIWAAFMIIAIGLYFYGFDNSANGAGLAYLKAHPEESFFGFFTFLGGAFDFTPDVEIVKRAIVPTLMGFTTVGILAFLIFKIFFKNSIQKWTKLEARDTLFIIGCLLFVLFNAGIIALLRPRFGYFVMLVGNYKIYPALFLSLLYLLVSSYGKTTTKFKLLNSILLFSILFSVVSYAKYVPEVSTRKKNLLVCGFNQKYNHIGLAAEVNSLFAQKTEETLTFLTSRNAYEFPVWLNESLIVRPFDSTNQIMPLVIDKATPTTVNIINNSFTGSQEGLNGAYVLLKSNLRTYLLPTLKNPYSGRNPFKSSVGFRTTIPAKLIQMGDYTIGIYIKNQGQEQVFQTKQTVHIDF